MAQKIILNNPLALGDNVVMTGAVRDLHRTYPGEYETAIRPYYPEVWKFNPYITTVKDGEGRLLSPTYTKDIKRSNDSAYHMIHGYRHSLEELLERPITQGPLRGDLYLSNAEIGMGNLLSEVIGDKPYWLISCGGKLDAPVKWWDKEKAEEVVDYFDGQLRFAQVGSDKDFHPVINGAINLIGKTTIRDLIVLAYQARGVISGITGLMHIAAALLAGEGPTNKPAVITAGGREPVHWEAYPHHTFLHTLGALPCCSNGGCWKSRVIPFEDQTIYDKNLCLYPTEVRDNFYMAKCMTMISSIDVIMAIEKYETYYLVS